MKDLTTNSLKYNSIFDQPFLRELHEIHETTGAKFTLYIYEKDGNYDINQFPHKFAEEFHSNSEWLKVGYHAMNPSISKDSISNYDIFVKSYDHVDSILTDYFKKSKSNTIRLHYFYATQEEVRHIHDKGVVYLLAADDERVSYSLSDNENKILISDESYTKNGMTYVSTDYRVERDNPFWVLLQNINDTDFVMFTHEWAYEGKVRLIFRSFIKYLYFCNCKFEN